jgi:hypothetical protein
MVHMVERLPSKCEALSSKKKKNQRKDQNKNKCNSYFTNEKKEKTWD